MIALKYLVIGIANHFQVFINKPFVNGGSNRVKMNFFFQVFKNAVQSF